MRDNLFTQTNERTWRDALASYNDIIAMQGVSKLAELNDWYCNELPAAISGRVHAHITLTELVRITEWKMARGVWRAPNLVLVRGNGADDVVSISKSALAAVPHATKPIALLATLGGVGPATASAVTAAAAPQLYPFFDELVAAQVPTLGKVAWTMGYYAKYAEALRQRAGTLGTGWTPVMVERALWSHVGGKTGTVTSG